MRHPLAVAALGIAVVLSLPARALPADDPKPADSPQLRIVTTVVAEQARKERPKGLMALYVVNGLLQAADGVTTLNNVRNGAVEANPMMGFASRNSAAMVAVKAATTYATIHTVENLWRDNHRTAAVAVAVLSTALSSWVVNHNVQVARQLR